jgi:hypothetical protein
MVMAMGADWLQVYVGKIVVCDLDQSYLVLGCLESFSESHVQFTDADLHDHREANSSKDVYIIESRRLGVRINRTRVAVPRHRLLAMSLLEEVAT